jgi:small subunit ribosomal protein S2
MAETKKDKINLDTTKMAEAGLHFGHRTSRINPKMKPYLAGVRNAVHLIDLEKTKEKLAQALGFIQKLISDNKTLLLVGTKIQVRSLVKEAALACDIPYVSERWLGGTFTNLGTILKRIEFYQDLAKKKAGGELEKYTKKEKAKIDKKLKEFETKFGGIKNLKELPGAVFVCDLLKDRLAVKEAKIKGVPIIGICDTNVDPALADFVIPANDDAISSVKYILEKVKEAILYAKHHPTKKAS